MAGLNKKNVTCNKVIEIVVINETLKLNPEQFRNHYAKQQIYHCEGDKHKWREMYHTNHTTENA